MSGIISAKINNGTGVWGTAGGYSNPGVKIMMLKINAADNPGYLNFAFIPEAIEYGLYKGVRIFNMSIKGPNNGLVHYTIQQAYENAGAIFIAGTGNEAEHFINYPAKYVEVIAVAATECDIYSTNSPEGWWENNLNGSNWGLETEISAPASYIIADVQLDEYNQLMPIYNYWTDDIEGSVSKAAAYVSGVIALMLSNNPCLTNEEVREMLKNTAEKLEGYDFTDGHNEYLGYGRIDALAALQPNKIDPVTGIITWTSNQKIFSDVIIEDQGELTIQNCTISMAKQYKIIVKPGGKLIIQNNAVLTGLCDQTWKGIEVWGNSSESQYTHGAQGKLTITSGSVIEDAVVAVELWKPYDNLTTGGIIEATDAIFRNNAKSIHAVNYRNYNPLYPQNEMDYYGIFTNCSFYVNDTFPGETTFNKHVDLDRVKGIKFYGCSFSLDHTATNVSQWNVGIAAYNAGFNLLPTCTTHVVPCPQIDSCRFNGFNWAIGVWAPAQLIDPPIIITNAHFDDNSTGVYINDHDYAVILENFFETGYDGEYHGNCDFADGVGIDIHQSIGFVVENNKFRKNSQAVNGNYAGIRVLNCPSNHDIIYKNELIGLSFGNYAEGINRLYPNNDATGVEYRCNFNFDNAIDFAVINYDPNHLGMIHGDQGFERPDTACGNYFSASASCHIWNDGYQEIDWIYNKNNILETPLILWQHPPYTFIDPEPVDDMNECPDHHGGGIHLVLTQEQRQVKEIEFAQNLADYNSVQALYESFIDGGNTEAELSGIQSAEPDEMWTLRTHLLGLSPHLSQEVLRAVSDRTDVFPDDALLDILSANPDELDKDTLLSYLEQKEDPLPDYMIEILRQVSDEITYKTLLQEDMAYYHAGKTLAAQDIIRSILNDTAFQIDDYRAWLDNLGGMEADKQIIASYLYENDTTSALALLQLIPDLYDLDGQALDDFIDYRSLVEMQIAWNTTGKTLLELESLDISDLEAFTINGASPAGNMARNILEYGNYEHYCNCLQLTDSSFYKNSRNYPGLTPINQNGLFVSVEPNPAKTWVAFNYELPEETSFGLLSISDASGKLLTQISIAGKAGQEVVNTEMFDPGLYYYSITVSGLIKAGKLIIQ